MYSGKSRVSDFLRCVITDNDIGINGILLYNTFVVVATIS